MEKKRVEIFGSSAMIGPLPDAAILLCARSTSFGSICDIRDIGFNDKLLLLSLQLLLVFRQSHMNQASDRAGLADPHSTTSAMSISHDCKSTRRLLLTMDTLARLL